MLPHVKKRNKKIYKNINETYWNFFIVIAENIKVTCTVSVLNDYVSLIQLISTNSLTSSGDVPDDQFKAYLFKFKLKFKNC